MSKLLASFPQTPLDPETEIKLSKRSDKSELVLHAMREAILYMTKCCRSKLPEDELCSLAYSALMKASENFRPGRGTRFMGYAKVYLRGEISRAWKSKDVVRSASMHESLEEIPEKFTYAEVLDSENGLDTVLAGKRAENTLASALGSADPEFELIDLHEKWTLIEPIIGQYLNEHERTILSLHYAGGLSFVEISKMVCPRVSRSAIQNSHGQALRKIRNVLMRVGRLYN